MSRRDDRFVSNPTGIRALTLGTFDLFHVGHLGLLRRAKSLCDWLIVGVADDEVVAQQKHRPPYLSLEERIEIVGEIRYVDEVFVQESTDLIGDYLRLNRVDVLVMGDDWTGRLDEYASICRVVYLPRTPAVSQTQLVTLVRGAAA